MAEWARWLGIKTFGDPAIEGMVRDCAAWANSFKNSEKPARWITLVGTSGVGKTHCAARLFDWANRRSDTLKTEYTTGVIYWPTFIQALRGHQSYGLRDDMKSWPVLYLDDIGAERDTTGFASEELNTLLGCRTGRWTILTANCTKEQLARTDSRIASRLIRGRNILTTVNTKDFALR